MADDYESLVTIDTGRKLTWEQVTELRAAYASGRYDQADLAVYYGVSQRTVSAIVRGERYITETPTTRAVPPIPSTMSGNMPAQLPEEDVHAYALRHNETFAAHNARLDARSEALLPDWRDEYAAAVVSVRAYWHSLGLDGDALDAAQEAA